MGTNNINTTGNIKATKVEALNDVIIGGNLVMENATISKQSLQTLDNLF